MKAIPKLFLLTVLCSLFFVFISRGYAQDNNIEGTWERQSTDIDINGIQIKVTLTSKDTYSGKLIAITEKLKGNCFNTGDLIWFNMTKGAKGLYSMDELWKKPIDCSTIHSSRYIKFTDKNSITITSMEIKPNTYDDYQIWVRVTDE